MNTSTEQEETVMHPPRAREHGAASTRTALIEAAAGRFGRYGYDGASVRDIARDAGVDAALVYRYFGSKDALFQLVSTNITLFDPLLEIPLEEVPAWICAFVTRGPKDDEVPHPVLSVLRSSSRGEALDRFRDEVTEVFTERFAARLEGPDARLRAELLAAWMLGTSLLCKAFRTPALDNAPEATLREHLHAGIAALLCVAPSSDGGGICYCGCPSPKAG
ncbi:TetR/AcrR family transcriptional regulator [Streptomyces sp. NPDC050161]|uniref:TetR/AcrR family transcriptional regulator n=1 Tax=Streptomyces sp. NPDC050161 TaxID=3365604 RepID=UPI00378FCF5D